MPLRLYSDSSDMWMVSCPICDPEIPEAWMYDTLGPLSLVPYTVANVEVALDVEIVEETGSVTMQCVVIKLKCENGHTWQYSLQAGKRGLGNVLLEDVTRKEVA